MKVEINKDWHLQLKEVYNPIVLVTKEGVELSICMRDFRFEIAFDGERFVANPGCGIEKVEKNISECCAGDSIGTCNGNK